MSASLVGSEMCIRDRPAPEPPFWRGPGGRKPPRGGHAANHCKPQQTDACLLYTSDAADDM
eukprot:1378380-Alexandrium_andersonii.AAC.1